MKKLLAFATLAGWSLFGGLSAAQTTELHVLSSNGMKAVVELLKPDLQRAAARPLAIEYGTSAEIRQRIESGASFDVAVLTVEVIDDLAQKEKVVPDSVGALGRSAIGIGVRAGVRKPDLATPDGVKKAFVDAKSVTWVGAGAARAPVDKMLGSLGIADAVTAKLALAKSVEEAVKRVADGQSDLCVMLASEILPAAGIQYAGPFPAPYTSYVSFAGAASPDARASEAANRFIATLRSPASAKAYEAKGMELHPNTRAPAP